MRRRTFLLGSATVFGAGSLITSTNAFSSTRVERGMHVDVVGDDEAFLRLKYPPQEITCATDTSDIQLVKIKNQTGVTLTSVTVDIDSIPDIISIESFCLNSNDEIVISNKDGQSCVDGSLDPGDEVSVFVDVEPTNTDQAGDIEFHVSARGDGISIDTTVPRSVTVQCSTLNAHDVNFQRKGNKVKFNTTVSASADVYYYKNQSVKSENIQCSETTQITHGDLTNSGKQIIALTIHDSLFISPFWIDDQINTEPNSNSEKQGFHSAEKVGVTENMNIPAFLCDPDELSTL